MRLAATFAIAWLAAIPAAAVTPDDSFLAAAKACQGLSAASVANTSFIQNATPMEPAMLAQMQARQLTSLAAMMVATNMDQAAIDKEPNLVPVFRGWTVGPVEIVLMSSPVTTEFACSVSIADDKFDLTLAELEPAVGFGKPASTFTVAGSRMAVWTIRDGRVPRAALVGTDLDGHKATILQVMSK